LNLLDKDAWMWRLVHKLTGANNQEHEASTARHTSDNGHVATGAFTVLTPCPAGPVLRCPRTSAIRLPQHSCTSSHHSTLCEQAEEQATWNLLQLVIHQQAASCRTTYCEWI
jgi:hypothetical protein